MPPTKLKTVVTVPHVQEISLFANADLNFWREKLKPEGVAPLNDNGRAALTLIGAHMKWMGVWFSELSISVALDDHAPAKMFLFHAFNSIPWFAWAERMFFKTPYYPGQTMVKAENPAQLALAVGGVTVLSAAMPAARPPAHSGDETWEGAILLPCALSQTPKATNCFVARLTGHTHLYPFAPTDTLTLAGDLPIIRSLRDSGITGKEWRLRAEAVHEKSETYRV